MEESSRYKALGDIVENVADQVMRNVDLSRGQCCGYTAIIIILVN